MRDNPLSRLGGTARTFLVRIGRFGGVGASSADSMKSLISTPSLLPSGVQPSTLAGLLQARAAAQPDREAYVFLGDGEMETERLTWGELDGRARAIAAALRESVPSGGRALLLYPPGLEFVAAFF